MRQGKSQGLLAALAKDVGCHSAGTALQQETWQSHTGSLSHIVWRCRNILN